MIEKTALYAGEDEYGRRVLPLHVRENDAVFEKTASELLPEVARFIDRLRPRVDVQYVLVNALGAGEYYGSNANADHFPEAALVHAPDPWTGTPEVDRVRAASWPYGYPTFYGAKVFLHHRNTKDHPHYGGIELAAWNPRMKRVELVLAIEKALCERHGGVAFWDRVRAGSSFDVSMGSRVPFDTCALHLDWKRYRAAQAMFDPAKGHRTPADAVLAEHKRDPIPGVAVTRKEYCDEMRTRPNAVLPDGRKVFVYNDYPKFFDISGVFVGADRTAKDLLKIAAVAPVRRGWAPGADLSTPVEGEKTAAAGKSASQSKRSEIVKGISAGEAARIVPGLARRDRDLSDRALHAIARSPEVGLTTAGGLGIVLRPREFQRVMMVSIGLPLEAAALDRAGSTFHRCPDCGADPLFPRMDPGLFSPLLARLLAPEAADRSMLGPSIERRVVVLSGAPPTPPKKALPPAKLASAELSGLLEKIAAAYAGYRARLPDVVAHAPFLMERVGVSELSKVACLEFTELFTPVSAAYLKRAFNDEA